ncbi:MAG: CRTAC1 family protein [Akkermansiaceae bacterium]|nr:CRTAC1 family protein [Akkermansiaceae bacterium]
MSQPFDRSATCEQPGEIDPKLGEFWVKDPFQINFENNLSSYERNRAFLNVNGKGFLEISHLTGADSDGDGRAVVAADLRGTGQMDLIVRQTGGAPLRIYENQFPGGNYLDVRLKGTPSNRLGIGARLEARIGDRKIYRDQFPVNSYRSQAPNRVHFGIGQAEKIDELIIRWPSGKTQTLRDIRHNQHLVITEE